MTNYKHTIISLFVFCLLISCGKTENKEESTTPNTTQQKAVETKKTVQTYTDSIDNIKASVLGNQHYKRKKESEVLSDTTKTKTITDDTNNTTPTITPSKKPTKTSFVYIKKILNECQTGVTMTQEDLEKKFNIPKEAMKLVKSVTKVAPNELEIKWKSTWMVEKVSDAKFKDGILKVRFEDNKMYASGGAISIKYEKKLYSDLVLVGRAARIPSVKGYYWQIGKDK